MPDATEIAAVATCDLRRFTAAQADLLREFGPRFAPIVRDAQRAIVADALGRMGIRTRAPFRDQ